ncbi:MAG: hypothetical protein KDA20_13090 [Phycisphaerales bacterium]|nr:hypothetical protein [Phycisphaerales bacterium]
MISIVGLMISTRCSRTYFDGESKTATIQRFSRAPIESSYLRDLIDRAHPVAFEECYQQQRLRLGARYRKLDMDCYREEVLRRMIALAVRDRRYDEAEELRKYWMEGYDP